MCSRPPRHPALVPLIRVLWATTGWREAHGAQRERVLPTGSMHLAFRLCGTQLRLLADEADAAGTTVGAAVVGGARSAAYLRDVSAPTVSVGAQLRPGAGPLFGMSAATLAERHVALADLWGPAAGEMLERLAAPAPPEARLALFEQLLAARLQPGRALHPAVARALPLLESTRDVRTVVDAVGISHRHFLALFRDAVGLQPKTWQRLTRFQRALALRAASPASTWAQLAHDAGYADQPHLDRDFRAFAGMQPRQYGRLAPANANHVPAGQFRTRSAGASAAR